MAGWIKHEIKINRSWIRKLHRSNGRGIFENGLSKYDVMPNDAIRIASTIGAVWENGDPANLGAIHTQNLMTPAPDIRQQSGLELLHSITGHAHLNADQVQQHSDQVASLTTGVEKQESTAKSGT